MNVDNVSREDWIVGGLALLLAISLLFFPWFHLSVTVGAFSASADYSATGTPDGWLGILALIAAVLVLADIAVERLSPGTEIPSIRNSRTETRFILAAVAAGFIALKFLFHIHFSLFGWGFYVTVILAAALIYFTLTMRAAGPSPADGTSRPGTGSADPPAGSASSGTPARTGAGSGGTGAEPGRGAGTGEGTGSAPGTGGSIPPPGS